MKLLKLIQIGDIHFPQARSMTLLDLQDEGFPSSITERVAIPILQKMVREITNQCETGIDGLLFCGDLTSKGSLPGYEECVRYLSQALDVSDSNRWPPAHLHVVPGNHDVCRDLCNDPADVLKKFEPLDSAWKGVGLDKVLTHLSRKTNIISPEGCEAAVFSLNSCIGCGETRFLPAEIREQLGEILKGYENEHGLAEAFELIGEKLDTPAFDFDEIDKVCTAIDALPNSVMPVVLGHHNILPQSLPRIAIYTEVLNAGFVRSRLSKCSKSVIYCHGHIHDNPVELVRQADPDGQSALICVAANQLCCGFNIIEIEYGRKAVPLGSTIKILRIENDGHVSKVGAKRVVLQPIDQAERLCTDRAMDFLQHIPSQFTRFNDALEAVRQGTSTNVQKTTLADALLEAEWFGLVQVLDRENEPMYWQVRKMVA